jgi:hypothetical protein
MTTELAEQFAYHRPPDESVATRHEAVRAAALALAVELVKLAPAGLERDRAIEHARLSMFWANAAIACHPLDPAG